MNELDQVVRVVSTFPRQVLIHGLTVALVLGVGCGSRQGYPGSLRGMRDVAIVVGGRGSGGLGFSDVNEAVQIVAIDGSERRDDWAGGDVHLLPGTYELDVEYAQMSSSFLFAGPIQAGMDVARAVEAGQTRRRIRFRVEAGRTYVIQYDTAARQYAVSDLYSAVWDPPAPVLAPVASSMRCVDERANSDPLGCVLLPTAAH